MDGAPFAQAKDRIRLIGRLFFKLESFCISEVDSCISKHNCYVCYQSLGGVMPEEKEIHCQNSGDYSYGKDYALPIFSHA